MQERQISIEEWSRLTREGADIPVQTLISGGSMRPLIRFERDTVRIIPLTRMLVPGDIVLFQREDGQYVVHRVVSVKNHRVQTLGDWCRNPDAWMDSDRIIGLVTHVYRGKVNLHVDSKAWRLIGRCWSKALPVRKVIHSVGKSLRLN